MPYSPPDYIVESIHAWQCHVKRPLHIDIREKMFSDNVIMNVHYSKVGKPATITMSQGHQLKTRVNGKIDNASLLCDLLKLNYAKMQLGNLGNLGEIKQIF